MVVSHAKVGNGLYDVNDFTDVHRDPMKRFSMAALFSLSITGVAAADNGVPLREAVPHITTTGHADIEVIPDLADIQLGVESERPTADAATSATADAAAAVIAAIKAHGIEPRDIKTQFGIIAQYDQFTDPATHVTRQTFRAYKATETFVVRVYDVSKAGSLARDLIAKGVNSFQGIHYTYSKEVTVRRQLQSEAIRDALTAAKTYTDAVNLMLGRVLQIGDEQGGGGDAADLPSRRAPPLGGHISVAIPTEPGTETLHEDISVIWEIEGKAR